MKNFKEILQEKNYSKKGAIASSMEISQEIYDIFQSNPKASNHFPAISAKKMTPDMFKVEIYRGSFAENDMLPPHKNLKGSKRGRTSTKMYDFLSLRWLDWFNHDFRRMNFGTAKQFNNWFDQLRKFKK